MTNRRASDLRSVNTIESGSLYTSTNNSRAARMLSTQLRGNRNSVTCLHNCAQPTSVVVSRPAGGTSSLSPLGIDRKGRFLSAFRINDLRELYVIHTLPDASILGSLDRRNHFFCVCTGANCFPSWNLTEPPTRRRCSRPQPWHPARSWTHLWRRVSHRFDCRFACCDGACSAVHSSEHHCSSHDCAYFAQHICHFETDAGFATGHGVHR